MNAATWYADCPAPTPAPPGPAGWARALLRGGALALLLAVGVAIKLPVRGVERAIAGQRRPLSPHVTQAVSRGALLILGLSLDVRGARMAGPGAYVANHTSWLDIFVLNARRNVCFVSKAEVADWPVIGWIARLAGAVFIARDPRAAGEQRALFEARLIRRDRLLFFPEGTSTDGQRVLPFKSTLFAAFYSDALRHEIQVQAVTVAYTAPDGADARFYGWWGDMGFGPHLVQMLAARRHGRVQLTYHPPVRADDFANRKSLASHLEQQVRSAHPHGDRYR